MVARRLGSSCVDVDCIGLCRGDWIVFQTLGGRVRWAFFLPITCDCSMFLCSTQMNDSLRAHVGSYCSSSDWQSKGPERRYVKYSK